MLSWSSHALRNAIALFYKRNKDGPVSSAVNTALLTSEIFSDNFNCQDAKEKGWHVGVKRSRKADGQYGITWDNMGSYLPP